MYLITSKPAAAATVVAVALIVAGDIVVPAINEFWAEHSMLTNLAASSLFVWIGLSMVKGWESTQEARRRQAISSVGYSSAARGPLAQRRTMWFLLYGGRFIGDPDFQVSEEQAATVRGVLARHGMPEIDEEVARRDSSAAAPEFLQPRLRALADDPEWSAVAHDLLRQTFFGFRLVLSRWTLLFATTEPSDDVLRELAAQAHEAAELFIGFREHNHDRSSTPSAEEISELVVRWRMTFANAVTLEWELAKLSDQAREPWPTDGRYLLPAADRERLVRNEGRRRPSTRLYASTGDVPVQPDPPAPAPPTG